jgi:16S rRNA (cytidine1402-2'-O)-methyltransferase
LPAGLYLVATPIGNLRDVTIRAIDTLKRVQVIYCEDTRITGRLLDTYGISTRMSPYHDHNAARVRPKIIERIKCGEAVALVSDAGTPLISDPGYKLVRAALETGLKVVPLPGPSALLAALVPAGLPTDRFLFVGFAPVKSAARRKLCREFATVNASLVIYETGTRLRSCLKDMLAVLGPREACLARELTKLYESFHRGSLKDLAQFYEDNPAPRGEMVLVIGPPGVDDEATDNWENDLAEELEQRSLRDAVDAVAHSRGLPRKEVYRRALTLQDRKKTEKK